MCYEIEAATRCLPHSFRVSFRKAEYSARLHGNKVYFVDCPRNHIKKSYFSILVPRAPYLHTRTGPPYLKEKVACRSRMHIFILFPGTLLREPSRIHKLFPARNIPLYGNQPKIVSPIIFRNCQTTKRRINK